MLAIFSSWFVLTELCLYIMLRMRSTHEIFFNFSQDRCDLPLHATAGLQRQAQVRAGVGLLKHDVSRASRRSRRIPILCSHLLLGFLDAGQYPDHGQI